MNIQITGLQGEYQFIPLKLQFIPVAVFANKQVWFTYQ